MTTGVFLRLLAFSTTLLDAETGTTRRGGSKPGWMRALAALPAQLPSLDGIVWSDVRDRNGDFRVRKAG